LTKRGVKAHDHCVIYTGDKPSYIKGEKIVNDPIRMTPDEHYRNQLDTASRINLAKPYTIEHNIKVCFIGNIEGSDLDRLLTTYHRINGTNSLNNVSHSFSIPDTVNLTTEPHFSERDALYGDAESAGEATKRPHNSDSVAKLSDISFDTRSQSNDTRQTQTVDQVADSEHSGSRHSKTRPQRRKSIPESDSQSHAESAGYDTIRPPSSNTVSQSPDISSNTKPQSNDIPQTQTVDQATDSGYGGSGSSKSQTRKRPFAESSLKTTIPESDAESAFQENQTVYSDTESLRDPKLLEYATAFSDELYGSLPPGFDKGGFERLLPVFDELLQAFAFKLGCDGRTPEHSSLVYLTHRYRQ
jgi:hypothetical protein